MDKIKMGAFLVALRNERNLTQQDEADIFSVTPQAISKWESGISIPDIETLEKLSTFYGVSINEILTGERVAKEEPVKVNTPKQNTEGSPFVKRLSVRIAPFVTSCSLMVLTLLFYFFPAGGVYENGYTLAFNSYQVLGGNITNIGNMVFWLNFVTIIVIFGMGFGLFFAKNALRFRLTQHILMYVSLALQVFFLAIEISAGVSPIIGPFLCLFLQIAYIVLFYALPGNRKKNVAMTFEDSMCI